MFKTALDTIAPISEANPDFDRLASNAEKRAVEIAERALNKSVEETKKEAGLTTEPVAKYKIEVFFGPKRTINGPNYVGISIWESGKRLHGGGDELMFWCENVDGTGEGCGSFISPTYVRGGVALCPNCNRMINADKLTTQKIGNVSTRNLAKEVARLFIKLDSNADIYCKFALDDVRTQDIARERGWDTAKTVRGLSIYPLKSILKDTMQGGLENHIYAFLTA